MIVLSKNLSFDATEYASRANAILGIRDSGKTYTATLIAEQLYDNAIPFFVFDPIGRWRFMRMPGAGHGYPIVVAGGAQPDLPLTPENAPDLIRAAMRAGVSMVIDLYSVKLSKADWRRIVRASIQTILYEGEAYGQRHVFLEEASEFIPQRVRDGATYAEVEKLARMGGNVGVGLTLVNQRAEEVNKAVLELCDNLLLHRQRGKNSLTSLRKWLDAGDIRPPKEITNSIATLPTGELWAWFKDIGQPVRIKVAQKNSFDPNRRALARSQGADGGAPKTVDVSQFIAQMRAALEGKPVKPVTVAALPRPSTIEYRARKTLKQEEDVKQEEADALRHTNTELNRLNGDLQASIRKLEKELAQLRQSGGEKGPESITYAPTYGGAAPDMDAIYSEIKRRLQAEPAMLRIALVKPEIEVEIKRHVVTADGSSSLGMIARLITEGFFDDTATSTAAWNETKRRGFIGVAARVYEACEKLTAMGFLTSEGKGIGYRAVKDMKVNVVERAA